MNNFVSTDAFEGYQNKMSNKLFGLLCEREKKDGNWDELLKKIHIQVLGMGKFVQPIDYWELLAKVGALRLLNYKEFRTTIFDCISLVKALRLKDDIL